MKKILLLSLLFLSVNGEAFALTTLKGEEARKHVGDAKAHFTSGNYTFEILARSHRDAMHGRFSDAIVFNADGGRMDYPRRKDGDHLLVVDAPEGREEEPVTEDIWRQRIANTLTDDNGIPTVYLDESGKELAVLYVGKDTKVNAKILDSGLLQLEITVQGGGRESRGRRRMMS